MVNYSYKEASELFNKSSDDVLSKDKLEESMKAMTLVKMVESFNPEAAMTLAFLLGRDEPFAPEDFYNYLNAVIDLDSEKIMKYGTVVTFTALANKVGSEKAEKLMSEGNSVKILEALS